jgi:molybdenum cofactor cytidylyltransferase/nicotine blue oxidoreductase
MNWAASFEHHLFASSAHSVAGVARVVGAVLAAGSGTRMGSPKAVLRVGGARLVDRAVAALIDGGCASVLAVVRSGTDVPHARVLVNDDPERGMRSSLALAVDAADGDALAVLLVDTPGVSAEAIRAVVATWRLDRVTVATYRAQRGHPTVMSGELWRVALTMAGPDEGARAFLASRPDLVDEVPVDGDPTDLDSPDDVAHWDTLNRPDRP